MPTKGSGMQKTEDGLFSETGKNRDGFSYGGGKTGKETDNIDKDRLHRSPLELTDIKTKIRSAPKGIS